MNAIYDAFRFKLLSGFAWASGTYVLSAWKGAVDFVAADTTVGAIKARAANQELGVSLPITGATVGAGGYAMTPNVVVPAVPAGPDVTWFTFAEQRTPHDSSELLFFIDTIYPPLPFVPNGLDIVLIPDWSLFRGWFRP